jgi:hypothetical protein
MTAIALPPPIERMLGELRRDDEFGHATAAFREAFAALEDEAFANHHAAQCMSALALIAEQNLPLRDRMIDICEVVEARGRVTVTIRRPS